MDENRQVPKPNTQVDILRRYLHILALLQNRDDPEKWNNTKLGDMLGLEEEGISDKELNRCTDDYIENELGIRLTKKQGARSFGLAEPIEEKMLMRLLDLYSIFVITDVQKNIVLQSLADALPEKCLWLLGRLHFAKLGEKVIRFRYTNNKGKTSAVVCHPYHLIYKNNNLYLAALRESDGAICLFVVNRIRDLMITTTLFFEEIPDVKTIFKYSLGSFISNKSVEVSIRFREELRNNINDFLSGLDPEYSASVNGWSSVSFSISDTMGLCKQLFLYGDKVEIVSPGSVREEMVGMLKKSLEVYEK